MPEASWGSPVIGGSAGKEVALPVVKCRWLLQSRRPWFNSWVRKIPYRRDRIPTLVFLGFPGGSDGKESACNGGDLGLILGSQRSPGGGHGNPLQFSWASLVAQMIKNPLGIQETWVWYLGWEDLLKEFLANQSSILAWRVPMDRNAWQSTVHGVAKSRTWLNN